LIVTWTFFSVVFCTFHFEFQHFWLLVNTELVWNLKMPLPKLSKYHVTCLFSWIFMSKTNGYFWLWSSQEESAHASFRRIVWSSKAFNNKKKRWGK
jgi:hypothetical protein